MMTAYDRWLLPKDQPEPEPVFGVFERLASTERWVRVYPEDYDQPASVDLDALLAVCRELSDGCTFAIRQVT